MRHEYLCSFARPVLAALFLTMPVMASAQADRCTVPARLVQPRPDVPTADQPSRVLPIGSYTLAISWSPQFCRNRLRDPDARVQCGGANRFGFVLHGLWPDGEGAVWPQYCRPAQLLPMAVIRANLCATPSVQLLQHEWAKHGTCMTDRPANYFTTATRLYGRLRYPDMNALSRRPLTAGGLARAIAAANPGMSPDMMRITANRRGWLDEVWLCLDKKLAFTRCPAHQGGLAPGATISIWRGRR